MGGRMPAGMPNTCGMRASAVKTCVPHWPQKWRVTLAVAAKLRRAWRSWIDTAALGTDTQVVHAAPLRRRHWLQWQ